MNSNIPVVGLAGFSNSGKTTFLENLIVELKNRGYRIGVIKHTHHRIAVDKPGTDTWRHAQAGADLVALAAPGCISLMRNCPEDPAPEKVVSMFSGVDLIIIEGYKKGKWPKIEVFQSGTAERPVIPPTELLAVVSDEQPPDHTAVPYLGLNDITGAADLLEITMLGGENQSTNNK